MENFKFHQRNSRAMQVEVHGPRLELLPRLQRAGRCVSAAGIAVGPGATVPCLGSKRGGSGTEMPKTFLLGEGQHLMEIYQQMMEPHFITHTHTPCGFASVYVYLYDVAG